MAPNDSQQAKNDAAAAAEPEEPKQKKKQLDQKIIQTQSTGRVVALRSRTVCILSPFPVVKKMRVLVQLGARSLPLQVPVAVKLSLPIIATWVLSN